MTAGTASTRCSSSIESWVLCATATAGRTPLASTTRWYLLPGLPRSTGLGPVSSPTTRADADRVDRRPRPVDLRVIAEPVQQPVVQPLPHAGGLPVPQPAPTGDRTAAAQLAGGQQPPGHPGAQHVDDPAEDRPVVDPGSATVAVRGLGWQQRADRRPGYSGLAAPPSTRESRVEIVIAGDYALTPQPL